MNTADARPMAANGAASQAMETMNLTIRCYDAVIQDLEKATKFQRAGDTESSFDRIRHAQDVMTELLVGLDYERGGLVAQNLSRIYNFILRQLIGFHGAQGETVSGHLIRMLEELRGAWKQVAATGC